MEENFLPVERIESKIYFVRGMKVMLDRDLALLYGVITGELNQAVKRNHERLPDDFMFQLTPDEAKIVRSQFVILRHGQHIKYAPYASTSKSCAPL